MLIIRCPFCGPRDEIEFRYRGDAGVARPAPDAGEEAFIAYVYQRENPSGWHAEYWLHAGGCRQVLKLVRHTRTHEIAVVGLPGDDPALPAEPPR